MSFDELSFATDRRSVQNDFYHFSYQQTNISDRGGFTDDSLRSKINKEYTERFGNISPEMRSDLVQTLVEQVPLEHHNLTFLAAANLVVHYMRSKGEILNPNISDGDYFTPEVFEKYFNGISSVLMSDLQSKTAEEIKKAKNKYILAFYRYLVYIIEHTQSFVELIVEKPLDVQLVDFGIIQDMFGKKLIIDYKLNPNLQSLATKSNVILTFIDNSGKEHHAEVQYSSLTNEIYPPN